MALRYADKLIYEARSDLSELYQDLQAEFDPAELVELGTFIGLNIGMVGHLVHSWDL